MRSRRACWEKRKEGFVRENLSAGLLCWPCGVFNARNSTTERHRSDKMQFLHDIGMKIGSTLSPKNVASTLKKFGGSPKEHKKEGMETENRIANDERKDENDRDKKPMKAGAKAVRAMTDDEYEQLFAAVLAKVSPAEEMSQNDSDDFESLLEEKGLMEKEKCRNEPEEEDKEESKEPVMTTKYEMKDKENPHHGESLIVEYDPQISKEKTKKETIAKETVLVAKGHKMKRKAKDAGSSSKPEKKKNSNHKVLGEIQPKRWEIEPKRSKRDALLGRTIEETGTWVQCSLPSCNKWRYLSNIQDPTTLPEVWTCPMNKDVGYNSCDTPEQTWDTTEEDSSVFTKYTEASLVWARMPGYPHWPGMVEVDPDYDTFFECRSGGMIVTHYHVVFFDEKVSRAWVAASNMRPFTGDEKVGDFKYTTRGMSYKKQISAAKTRAMGALKLSLSERLKKFSFALRYHGKWGMDDSQHSEATDTQEEKTEKVSHKKKEHSKRYMDVQGATHHKSKKTKVRQDSSKKSVAQPEEKKVSTDQIKKKTFTKSNFFKKESKKTSPGLPKKLEESQVEESHLERDVSYLLGNCEAIIQDADKVLQEFLSSQEGTVDKQLKSRLSQKHSSPKETPTGKDGIKKKKKKKKLREMKEGSAAIKKPAFSGPKPTPGLNQEAPSKAKCTFDPYIFTMEMESSQKEKPTSDNESENKIVQKKEHEREPKGSLVNPQSKKIKKKKGNKSFVAPIVNQPASLEKVGHQSTTKTEQENKDPITPRGEKLHDDKPHSRVASQAMSDEDMFLDLDTDAIPSSISKVPLVNAVAGGEDDSDAMEFQEE